MAATSRIKVKSIGMGFFFEPRSIAVIGASPNPAKGSNILVRNLRAGFDGNIYPVNPKYDKIEELTCYPTVRAIPSEVDLAIMLVPSSQVLVHLEDCIAAKIPGVIIESGGFAEGGPEGEKIQSEITRRAKETGIRIWGPNCMGIVDGRKNRAFSFIHPHILKAGLVPGDVSLVVQSGVLASTYLDEILSNGLMGISKICSIGNKADVNECDILAYLLEDPQTKVIGCYLESFSEGTRFLDLCRKGDKPVIVLKGGKSVKGARAAMSHTASMAGNQGVISGVLAQAGVYEAHDFRQLIDFCRTLAMVPSPPAEMPGRIAILTFSGGAGILASDFLDESGLFVADLAEKTTHRLQQLFPDWMLVNNPIDIWPAVEKSIKTKINVLKESLRVLLTDPGVDAVLLLAVLGNPRADIRLADFAEEMRLAGKPILCSFMGNRDLTHRCQVEARDLNLPVYPDLYRAVECMSLIFKRRRV